MKHEDQHNLSDEEINQELERQRRHLYDVKSQAVTEKLEDTTQPLKARRQIARLLTERRARQLTRNKA